MLKKIASILIILTLLFSLVGCSEKTDTSGAAEAAEAFIKNFNELKWDIVLKSTTGDQLAVFQQLIPVLKTSDQKPTLKKVEVIDVTASAKTNIAFVTVHYIRTLDIPEYGSVMDDRQVLLSMKKIDGEWKIFKIDTISELQSLNTERSNHQWQKKILSLS